MRLTPAERRAWREDGFFARESIFDAVYSIAHESNPRRWPEL